MVRRRIAARALGCLLLGGLVGSACRAQPRRTTVDANAGVHYLPQAFVDDDQDGYERVTLDGSGSLGAIARYDWSEQGERIATGVRPTMNLPVGEHTITLTVTGRGGQSDTDDVTIVVDGSVSQLPDGFQEVLVIKGLTSPTAMAFAPDGRLFVTEQTGTVRIITHGRLLPTPFLTVPAMSLVERGLLGIAFDPQFEEHGYVYVYYTLRSDAHPTDYWTKNRVSRFAVSAMDPDVADPASELVILDDLPAAIHHNAGALHFGPDGRLYVAVGDALDAASAQRLDTLHGKLLRIDPSAFPEVIPPDNPFAGRPAARGEIWAYGLRNPFVFAIDPVTGTMHINDVGLNDWEEINLGRKGANYGWPECEGPCDRGAFDHPIYAYDHTSGGCAIVGGTFYRGTNFPPEYHGSYFFADLCRFWIKRLTPQGTVVEFSDHGGCRARGIVNLSVGPDGSLYYLSNGQARWEKIPDGAIYRISYVGGKNHAPRAAVSAQPEGGPAPLAVELSAGGCRDPDGDPLTYRWELGDGSPVQEGVMVRHTYQAVGSYAVQLTATDSHGTFDTAMLHIGVGNRPAAQMTAPADGTTFQAGQAMAYAGTAADVEDGPLSATAFRWWVDLHHHAEGHRHHHTHPFQPPVDGVISGSFEIPPEVHDQDIWLRLHLSVTDTDGLTATVTRDLLPQRAALTFATRPPGLRLTLDGQPLVAPMTRAAIVGSIQTVGVPPGQIVGERRYQLASWSDGEAATHSIRVPAQNTTYLATFAVDPSYDPTLVGHWEFDEGHGAVAADSSGHGVTGMLGHGPTWTAGRVGGALSFDGVDDSVDTDYKIDTPQWTVAVWVRSPAPPTGATASGPVHRDKNYQINWNHPDPRLRGAAALRIKERWYAASFGKLRGNTWYHLTATYDGVGLKAYTNGVFITTTAASGVADSEFESLNLGRHAAAAQYFHGTIDDVRLYSRALSAKEVRELFQEALR